MPKAILGQPLSTDESFMRMALREAVRGAREGEVPVGAVIVLEGRVLARAHNRPIHLHDPSAHAEILAIRRAAKRRFPWGRSSFWKGVCWRGLIIGPSICMIPPRTRKYLRYGVPRRGGSRGGGHRSGRACAGAAS